MTSSNSGWISLGSYNSAFDAVSPVLDLIRYLNTQVEREYGRLKQVNNSRLNCWCSPACLDLYRTVLGGFTDTGRAGAEQEVQHEWLKQCTVHSSYLWCGPTCLGNFHSVVLGNSFLPSLTCFGSLGYSVYGIVCLYDISFSMDARFLLDHLLARWHFEKKKFQVFNWLTSTNCFYISLMNRTKRFKIKLCATVNSQWHYRIIVNKTPLHWFCIVVFHIYIILLTLAFSSTPQCTF